MPKLTCTITPYQINLGIVQDCEHCPGALAICEATPLRPVYVDWDYVEVGPYKVETPSELADFIETFDRCQPVKPVTFELELPEGP